MDRQFRFSAVISAIIFSSAIAQGQAPGPTRVIPNPSQGDSALRPNSFAANNPVAMTNKIIKPVLLSVEAQRSALTNIDLQILGRISQLSKDLKSVLPDELAMLAKTTGWKTEDQQALVTSLRSGDPTNVYESWVKGNPQDTAGAELAARQTDAKRLMTRMEQDAEKNKPALKQDLGDFDAALGKIAGATQAVSDLGPSIRTLKTWVEARRFIDSATPGKGTVARLPTGNDVTLIYDPTLAAGTAIVLNDQAILIGHEGHSALIIATGNSAEALGLPIISGTPISELEGQEATEGVLIFNPAGSRGTINYNINGNHYVAQPGMKQHLDALPNGRTWHIDFDRGEGFGAASYTLSPGTYHFRPTDRGWEFFRLRFEVAIDNSQNNQEFNFIYHGDNLTLPAGDTRTLSSNYPIVIRFDRRNGSEFVTKWTQMTVGTLVVGVNANDNLWDLFAVSEYRRDASKLKPFNTNKLQKTE